MHWPVVVPRLVRTRQFHASSYMSTPPVRFLQIFLAFRRRHVKEEDAFFNQVRILHVPQTLPPSQLACSKLHRMLTARSVRPKHIVDRSERLALPAADSMHDFVFCRLMVRKMAPDFGFACSEVSLPPHVFIEPFSSEEAEEPHACSRPTEAAAVAPTAETQETSVEAFKEAGGQDVQNGPELQGLEDEGGFHAPRPSPGPEGLEARLIPSQGSDIRIMRLVRRAH